MDRFDLLAVQRVNRVERRYLHLHGRELDAKGHVVVKRLSPEELRALISTPRQLVNRAYDIANMRKDKKELFA